MSNHSISWKTEVRTSDDQWCSTGLRFATHAEAMAYGLKLAEHWLELRDWRATPTSDPVTDRFADGKLCDAA